MITERPSPRIDGIVAREANVAVVFRRGPTRATEMLLWNLDTDEVTSGQWVKARVYAGACDLSPNGDLLVAMLGDWGDGRGQRHGRKHGTGGYTTISRPPYFTALAVSVHGTTWWGGGFWRSNDHLELSASAKALQIKAKTRPSQLRITEISQGGPESAMPRRLRQAGWRTERSLEHHRLDPRSPEYHAQIAEIRANIDHYPGLTSEAFERRIDRPGDFPIHLLRQRGVMVRSFAGGTLRWTRGGGETWEALDLEGQAHLTFQIEGTGTQWLDLDHRGRVVYGSEGCLWAWEDFPSGEPKLVADLNGHTFRAFEAPASALCW